MYRTAILIATLALTARTEAAPKAAPTVTPFTFAHISDTHIALSTEGKKHDANLEAAIAEMNAMTPRPAFIVHTGDITEMGDAAQFERYKEDVAGARMPIKASPGNHETRWADQSINRFAEELGSPNISFKVNGVRFIGFNAAIWLEHHGVVSGDTRRWIVSQLKLDPPGTPAILFAHQPPMYPDNVFMTGDVELWKAIAPYNVRVFLNGHGHIFKSWTVNGIFCHMTKGMMNDAGGYTLYKVGTDAIRVYDKLNGQDPQLVATVPLVLKPVHVAMAMYRHGRADGSLSVSATVRSEGPTVERVEYLVDHHERPDDKNWTRLDATGKGRYAFTLDTSKLSPGRHTLAVRAVDADGGVWMDVQDLPAFNEMGAKVFNAGTALQGPAAADAASVYVGGWDGKLYAVDRKTMKPRWTVKTGGAIIGRPDVDTTSVYCGSTDENVYAIDKATGHVRWKLATGGPIQAHTRVANGTVYVASGDHKLYAIDAKTGQQKWAYTMGAHAQAQPAVWNGTVYIGAWDGKFYAIDAKTGSPRWTDTVSKSLFFSPAVSSPCVVGGKVIMTQSVAPSDSEGPHVLCLDAKTGEKVWGYRLPSGSSAYSSPTSDGKKVYLATLSGGLYALNLADGSVAWESKLGEIAYDCSPVYQDGQVICNGLMGSVEGHDAATGKRLWSYKTGGGLTFAWPTVTKTAVYEPSMDGTLTLVPLGK